MLYYIAYIGQATIHLGRGFPLVLDWARSHFDVRLSASLGGKVVSCCPQHVDGLKLIC